MTDTPMTPECERQIRSRVAEMSNYSLGNLFARDLLAEVDRLRKALSEAAAWLVRAGYPVDWSTHEPPPAALREAVIDAVHADPTGTVHGGEITRDEVAAWLAVEVRAFAHPDGEPTP